MQVDYVFLELENWGRFLGSTLVLAGIALHVLASLILTMYGAWYVSGFITFLRTRNLQPQPSGRLERLPPVVILVPVYNDYELLSSLRTLLAQDYPNYRVIVVDDSDDEAFSREIKVMEQLNRDKLIHLKRDRREGLKAGALNYAIDFIESNSLDVKYVLILDADFELERDMLRRYVEIAEQYGADIVQGLQRHSKGSHTLFGTVYRAAASGSIVNLAGRAFMNMMPIFTGSCALIRYELLCEVRFRENSIAEDWRWTIDAYLAKETLVIIATDRVYGSGSVPKTQKAFIRQQVRWSTGTLLEFKETLVDFLFDTRFPASTKLGYAMQGLLFTQGIWIYYETIAPFLLKYLAGVDVEWIWPIGLYVWLICFETLVLSGALLESYDASKLTVLAVLTIPMIYYTALIHSYGTLKALIGRGVRWRVTSKRGSYEKRYRE